LGTELSSEIGLLFAGSSRPGGSTVSDRLWSTASSFCSCTALATVDYFLAGTDPSRKWSTARETFFVEQEFNEYIIDSIGRKDKRYLVTPWNLETMLADLKTQVETLDISKL
jgi:hypothetical protein